MTSKKFILINVGTTLIKKLAVSVTITGTNDIGGAMKPFNDYSFAHKTLIEPEA